MPEKKPDKKQKKDKPSSDRPEIKARQKSRMSGDPSNPVA